MEEARRFEAAGGGGWHSGGESRFERCFGVVFGVYSFWGKRKKLWILRDFCSLIKRICLKRSHFTGPLKPFLFDSVFAGELWGETAEQPLQPQASRQERLRMRRAEADAITEATTTSGRPRGWKDGKKTEEENKLKERHDFLKKTSLRCSLSNAGNTPNVNV